MRKLRIALGISLIVYIFSGANAFTQWSEEKFIYDARSRRDPLVPLLDKSGVRTDFTAPEKKVRLPMEVLIKGVLRKGDKFYAIINGQVMTQGDSLGEIKIKKIQPDKVVLEYSGQDFEILLRKEKTK